MSTSQLFFLLESIDICYRLCNKEVASIFRQSCMQCSNQVCTQFAKWSFTLSVGNTWKRIQWKLLTCSYWSDWDCLHQWTTAPFLSIPEMRMSTADVVSFISYLTTCSEWYNTGELHFFTLSWLYHYKLVECWCYQQYDNYAVIWGRDGQRSSDNQDWEVELWTSQSDQSWQSAGTYILDGRSGIVLATP